MLFDIHNSLRCLIVDFDHHPQIPEVFMSSVNTLGTALITGASTGIGKVRQNLRPNLSHRHSAPRYKISAAATA
jgi:hypothetical protein